MNIIDALDELRENNGTIYICGNGGSASIATHIACDLAKIAGINAISLCTNIPLITAITNDEGFDYIFEDQLRGMEYGDLLMVISVHGTIPRDDYEVWSQNLVRAVDYTRNYGNKAISLTGFDGGMLKDITDYNININIESTPIVESMHSIIGHIIAFNLKEVDRE